MAEPVAVAVLAKAPIPGFAKTRLIPTLGEAGAAALQARLIERAVRSACAAGLGPVTVWATPDEGDAIFTRLQSRLGIALARQGNGDLGARMLAAIAAADMPTLVIGTDCPALTSDHLRNAADILRARTDVVIFPAEDGGYALIGMRQPHPALFADMVWSAPGVMAETRRRLQQCGLTWEEPLALWDVDTAADLERLREAGLHELIASRDR
jgi:rSAM/selenodomain-associated transferase 1